MVVAKGGGGKKSRYYISILRLRGGSELPLDCEPALVHSHIGSRSGKWALGQCEALELEEEEDHNCI